jgi:hypothetical protein
MVIFCHLVFCAQVYLGKIIPELIVLKHVGKVKIYHRPIKAVDIEIIFTDLFCWNLSADKKYKRRDRLVIFELNLILPYICICIFRIVT